MTSMIQYFAATGSIDANYLWISINTNTWRSVLQAYQMSCGGGFSCSNGFTGTEVTVATTTPVDPASLRRRCPQ